MTTLALNWFPTIPPDVAPWVYFVFVCGAVLSIGISKAGFGGAIGIITVPLMTIALPADRSIGVMLPIMIAADIFASMHHMKHRSNKHLHWMLPGAVVGVLLGAMLMYALKNTGGFENWLNLIIGGLCLVFVLFQVFRMLGGHVPRVPDGAWPGRISGTLAGITSMLAHSAGPVVSIYLLEREMEKKLLVGTMVLFFFAMNLMKLLPFFWLDLIDPATLVESLWLLPLVPVGTLLGYWLHQRIPEKPFVLVVYIGTAAAGANMLYKALG